MQKISKSVPDVKVPGRWLTSCPVYIDELSLRKNWALISPRAVDSSSSFSVKAVIGNRNRTMVILYPCLTPNF